MRGVCCDLRIALRLLRNNPGFTISSILTLVLGVLLNTAAFGVVNALWFGKLPFRDGDRVLVLTTGRPAAGVSWQDFEAARTQLTGVFSGLAAFRERVYNLAVPGPGSRPEQARGGMISSSALAMLGYAPILGRSFTAAEQGCYTEAAGPPVVLIGEGLWRRQFAADTSVIGRSLRLDGAPARIVGVLPSSFRFVYSGYQVIAPLSREVLLSPRSERQLEILARIRPGIAVQLANEQLHALSHRLNGSGRDEGVLHATPYRQAVFGEALRMYPVLFAATLLLLLLVCANLSNLMLAKTAVRTRELAIRLAVGAGRARIVRQLLTEGTLMAAIGGVLSLILAVWMRQVVVASVPELSVFAVDFRVAAYTLVVALVAGLAFALAPALHATSPRLSEALKPGGAAESRGAHRLGSTLIAAQVAVALVLLAGMGLLARSVANLRYVDKGIDLNGAGATVVHLQGARYADAAQRLRFWEQLAEAVSAAPGIESAGVTGAVPLTSMPVAATLEMDGMAAGVGRGPIRLVHSVADPPYMKTVRWKMFAGRGFTAGDRAGSQRVVIVSEAVARRFFAAKPEQAIGRRLRVGSGGEWSTIVGIACDARQLLVSLPAPEVIMPVAQAPERASTLVVRSPALGAEAVRQIVSAQIAKLDPDLPAGDFFTEKTIIEMFYPKVMIAGLGILAAVAMALSALGLYGVVSFVVARRSREVGIRVAMGATRRSIMALVLWDGLRVVAAGTLAGLAGALAMGRALRAILFGVQAADPLAFTAAPLAVVAVALLALVVPALRASRIEPAAALRAE